MSTHPNTERRIERLAVLAHSPQKRLNLTRGGSDHTELACVFQGHRIQGRNDALTCLGNGLPPPLLQCFQAWPEFRRNKTRRNCNDRNARLLHVASETFRDHVHSSLGDSIGVLSSRGIVADRCKTRANNRDLAPRRLHLSLECLLHS